MKKVIFALAVILPFMSCKKSAPVTTGCEVNVTNIAGVYTISSIKYKSSSSATETDLFALMQDCQKDDTYELKADGTIVISEAANNCGLPPLPGTPTNWVLTDNNTRLEMGDYLTIVSFDCSKLVVEQKNVMADGDSKTITYEKQ